MAAVANEQRKEYVERRMYLSARNKEMNDKIEDRIKNHPEARDVLSGDALSAAMEQLMDPQISESSCRYAEVPLPVDMIRRIPFRLGERGENFSMNRLTIKGKGKWPVAFQDKRFATELKEFESGSRRSPGGSRRRESTDEQDCENSDGGRSARAKTRTDDRC